MKDLIKYLISFKLIKILIGSLIATYIIIYLYANGFIEFIIKTLENLWNIYSNRKDVVKSSDE